MKNTIVMALPALAAALMGAPAQALNSTSPSAAHRSEQALEHVIVSIPAHKKDARTAMPVTVIDGEALRRAAATSLGETLQQSPGLANASFGAAVGQPVIRGLQGPRVQVLQNGLPSLDVATNSADHAVSVEPILADSIEVLRGTATLLYGGGAIGGIVNVLDNRIPSRQVKGLSGAAEIRHNSVDDGRSGVVRLDGGDGRWAFHVDGLYRDWSEPDIPGLAINPANVDDIEENSDGFIANADGLTRRQTLGGAYHFDNGYWGLSYSRLRNQYGIPGGVHHHHDEEHQEHADEAHDEHEEEHEEEHHHDDHGAEEGGLRLVIDQTRWDLAGDVHGGGFWELLRWRLAHSEYRHVEVEPNGEVGTRFERDSLAGRLELSHRDIGNWHGVVGIQWLDSDFAAEGEEAFVPATGNRNLGLFWLEDYHGDGWQIEMGLRAELDELRPEQSELPDRDSHSFSASLGGLIDLNEHWQLSLSLSESRRAPTTEELYANILNDADNYVVHGATGAIEVGNSDLGREKSHSADLGLNADYGPLQGRISVFYTQFQGFIHLANTGVEIDEAAVLEYQQQDAAFHGLEYQLSYQLWQGAGELTLSLFGDRLRAELDNGSDIPRLPPRRDGLRLSANLGAWYGDVSWQRAADQHRPGEGETATDGYDRVDATLSWQQEWRNNRYTVSLKGRNLGDEEIRSSSSFIRDYAPEPGRSLELALRVNFDIGG